MYWPHVVLIGDLFHTTRKMFHTEHWLSKYAPGTRFIRIPSGLEYLYLPPTITYRVDIKRPLSFHLRINKPVNLLLKRYRGEYFKYSVTGSLEDYIKKRIREEYSTDNLEEAAEKYYKQLLDNAVPYNRRILDYPKILKKYVKRKFNITL